MAAPIFDPAELARLREQLEQMRRELGATNTRLGELEEIVVHYFEPDAHEHRAQIESRTEQVSDSISAAVAATSIAPIPVLSKPVLAPIEVVSEPEPSTAQTESADTPAAVEYELSPEPPSPRAV